VATRFLAAQARLIARRPVGVIVVAALLTAAATGLTVSKLGFRLSRLELLDPDLDYITRYQDLEREFGDLDAIVVAVVASDQAPCRAFAAELADRIKAEPERFRSAFYRVDPGSLGGGALLLAPAEQLAPLRELTARAETHLVGAPALSGLLSTFAAELEEVAAAGESRADTGEALGHLAHDLLAGTVAALRGTPPAQTPLASWEPFGDEGYTWAEDERTLIMLVQARDTDEGIDPKTGSVKRLRQLVTDLEATHPGVRARLTGKPVLQVDEMETYAADSLKASALAFLGVTVLLMTALRRLLAPLLVGLCLVVAVVWTLGLTSIWPGHLNLLAVVFVVIVIGLGVDFGIHLVARYDERILSGDDPPLALEDALTSTGAAVAVGAMTTVVAFLSCLLTSFRGLREFGAIAALGVGCSLLVMTTVLPALVLLLDRGRRRRFAPRMPRLLGVLDGLATRHPRRLLAAVLFTTGLAATVAWGIRYERSLIALQDPELDSVQLELELLDDRLLTSWFLALPGDDPVALAEAAQRLEAMPGVERTEGVHDVIPPRAVQEARLEHVRPIQATLERYLDSEPQPLSVAALDTALVALEDALASVQEQALAGNRLDAVEALEAMLEQAATAQELLTRGLGAAPAWDAALDRDLRARVGAFHDPSPQPLVPADLPPPLQARLRGATGQFVLRIYPAGNMWDYEQLDAFVSQVSAAEPEVTGVPVVVRESTRLMVEGYQDAGIYALIAVCLCLLIFFRSLRETALALGALAVGSVWTLALIVAAGSSLNPANLVALPLLLGIGIDSAVHVIHRARGLTPGEPLLAGSLGRALVYSTLTSVAGFGSLLLARHVGTASIGSSISLGVLSCLGAALTLPPALLALLRRRGQAE
jgi:hopanoid biosynthesis associated RND transporter like protein HpnN